MKKVLSLTILGALASFAANANQTNADEFSYGGVLSAGAYYNKGATTSQQYNIDAKGTLKHDDWAHGAGLSYYRAKDGDNVSASNITASYHVDKFIYEDIFWDANAEYKHDWVESIKGKATIGTGVGYKAFDNEYGALSLTGLVGYQNITYKEDNSNAANHAFVKLNWDYGINVLDKSVKLYTNGNIGRALNKNVTLDTTVNVGAAYRLSEWLSLNTGVTYSNTKTSKANTETTKYTFGVTASF